MLIHKHLVVKVTSATIADSFDFIVISSTIEYRAIGQTFKAKELI